MTKITILGSGTTNLAPSRNAASVLIQRNDRNYVYDFGRGTATQLAGLGLMQDDIHTIILSHYHPDHVSDLLPYLHAASWSQIDKRTKPLTIYGQPSIDEFMAKFTQPFGERELSKDFETILENLAVGEMTIEGSQFSFTDLNHSYGISFEEDGKNYAIMADSDFHDGLVGALTGVELGVFDAGHITDDEIVELAVKTQAKMLVCSHQYRELNEDTLNKTAKEQGFEGQLIVAEDLMEFDL